MRGIIKLRNSDDQVFTSFVRSLMHVIEFLSSDEVDNIFVLHLESFTIFSQPSVIREDMRVALERLLIACRMRLIVLKASNSKDEISNVQV